MPERTENNNCLAGMKCPECESLEPFDIHASVVAKVYDDGTDEHRSVEWTDESMCRCCGCNHLGTVAGFRVPQAPGPIKLPCYGIVVQLDGKGGGTIDSELHFDLDVGSRLETDKELSRILDGIEAMVLAHACAGIDISTPAYIQGIETAVDKAHSTWG